MDDHFRPKLYFLHLMIDTEEGKYIAFEDTQEIYRTVSWFRDHITSLMVATRPVCQVMNMKCDFVLTKEISEAFEVTKQTVANAC
ncbi:Hypothetical protein SRAE_0000054000 [Strongyloides ratti]|uniref:Uncharacterized protein n=1 Tax=Strongyloides ratti TaxID=34506 RepID=A0A090KVG3_STRRB|nr:Hypothetical protein SRAE_0000054000 [Strongyloides ratti]CEF61416.1 Hypothetical protein SRAE_0000054000 [Strongyloides ratti]